MQHAVRVTLLPGRARRWTLLATAALVGAVPALASGARPGDSVGLLVALAIVSGFSALWSP